MRKEPEQFVEHPRYGRKPKVTGYNPQPDGLGKIFLHWHSPEECRISNTAIKADITKQKPATIPVTDYYDVERICHDCGKPFIFFAEEQKFWYETLNFVLEADCIRCVNCRNKSQEMKLMIQTYEKLIIKESRTNEERNKLKNIALELYQLGYIRDVNKLNKIR